MQRAAIWLTTGSCLLFWAGSAAAQDAGDEEGKDYIVDEESDDTKKDGVDWLINAGATLSFSDNRTVIGQIDGSTFTFGMKFDASVELNEGDHEWRNRLNIAAGITRTPVIPQFIKSQDNLDFETIYLYHIVKWFGPFARFGWSTPMFRATDVRPDVTTYSIARLDGSVDTVDATRLSLTDALRPSRLRESLGLFFQPVAEEPINVEFRLGGGARHILAEGQLAIADDEATDQIEVVELDDVNQLGAEATLEVWGTLEGGRITYRASADAMTPFVHNELPPGDNRSSFELTNLTFMAGLSFKIVDWASLDYQFKALREPQLLDEFQIQNQLLFSFGIADAGGPNKAEAESAE